MYIAIYKSLVQWYLRDVYFLFNQGGHFKAAFFVSTFPSFDLKLTKIFTSYGKQKKKLIPLCEFMFVLRKITLLTIPTYLVCTYEKNYKFAQNLRWLPKNNTFFLKKKKKNTYFFSDNTSRSFNVVHSDRKHLLKPLYLYAGIYVAN